MQDSGATAKTFSWSATFKFGPGPLNRNSGVPGFRERTGRVEMSICSALNGLNKKHWEVFWDRQSNFGFDSSRLL